MVMGARGSNEPNMVERSVIEKCLEKRLQKIAILADEFIANDDSDQQMHKLNASAYVVVSADYQTSRQRMNLLVERIRFLSYCKSST